MANRTFNDLSGLRFGRLRVIHRASVVGARDPKGRPECVRWLCECDCGITKTVTSAALGSKKRPTLSCGCLRRERIVASVRKHGAYLSAEYTNWQGMITRCYTPSCTKYADYGGRGIRVCDRWRADFASFLADMGTRPYPKATIERINNDGPYSPENCKWATRAEQQKNRRNSRLITFNGRTETAHMWSKITGIASRTITNRLDAGWPPERILTAAPRKVGFGAKASG